MNYRRNLKFQKIQSPNGEIEPFFEDKSSCPKKNEYSLGLDELVELVYEDDPKSKRSAVYRLFKANDINKIPEEKKEQAKKIKEYSHGYLQLDVTYLPKIDGKKWLKD